MNRFFTLLFAASCLTAVGQVPDYVPTDGLVAWYNFDGNANDHSGNEQNASSSSVSYTEGPNGAPSSAAHFNGNAQIVVPHHDIWNSEEYTLSIGYTWQINPAAYPNGDSWFFSKREESGWGSSFEHGPMGALSWSIGGNGWAIADFLPPQNEWIQMAWVFGSDSIKFYLDAELVHVVASPGPMNFNTLPISIGMRGNGWHGFIGDIDYIGYWSRQITAEEVVGLHNVVPPVAGCMEMNACNFNPDAAIDDGTCDLFTCKCLNGTVWDEELQGCISANTADINNDGCVQLNDLLDLLSAYGDCGAEESAWQCGDPLEYQGYDYETVPIGEQCWFAENLRAENYRNGEAIPTELNLDDWIEMLSGARTTYSNDESSVQAHGFLYNWFAVMDSRRICPLGWSEPSNVDWLEMETHLGLDGALVDVEGWRGNVGYQLKNDEMSEVPWNGSNEASFNGTPSGFRQLSGGSNGFVGLGSRGEYWTTSDALSDASNKISRSLDTDQEALGMSPNSPNCGFSVRCIKDTE